MSLSIEQLHGAFAVAPNFTRLPTPIEPMSYASEVLGAEVFVKRDDLSGIIYGGNKVRKLAYLLGDATAEGFLGVCTVGAIGSNHVLATTLHARKLGLDVSVLHFPQPVTPHVRHNLRALSTLAPELTHIEGSAPKSEYKATLSAWLKAHSEAYYIPAGGSSPMGALGYVQAALELAEQWTGPRPDVIVVAAGTCGTLAGLRLGLAYGGWSDTPIAAVRVVERSISNPHTALRLATQAAEMIATRTGEAAPQLSLDDFDISDAEFGEGYGVPTRDGEHAIETAAVDGLHLEPTYTAKTFAAVLKRKESRVLYWHTLSNVDLSARIAASDINDLPASYHGFFEDDE